MNPVSINAFKILTGFSPLSWQSRLFSEYLEKGGMPSTVDIPTGLGKTAVLALWLIARAGGAMLPRRLVYVVDRRAVVDQATEFAEKLRTNLDAPEAAELKQALNLDGRSLPISTLRGQFVDNRDWLEDPASPAIIVGTVDMIGSRLLFEGYGVSRKMRPYHAGLLGADSLVVLDEAHLVPPFEKLLEAVEQGSSHFAARAEADRKLIPPFRLLSLSATGRERAGAVFRLEGGFDQLPGQRRDLDDAVVAQRLGARKNVTIIETQSEKLATTLATQAWALAQEGKAPIRCIAFCNERDTAEKVKVEIEKLAQGDKKAGQRPADIHSPELFVGARRVLERADAAGQLKQLGFIAGSDITLLKPAFLIATSAGEVGVDLDADHMVCDLVAWERMVQRLGRVNRLGEGDAKVVVVVESEPKPKDGSATAKAIEKSEADRNEKEKKAVEKFNSDSKEAMARTIAHRSPFGVHPILREDGTIDASPGALRDLKIRAASDESLRKVIEAATTPRPLRPALTRALVDAWSMTSLEEHTGRPDIKPWIRGWVDDKPQTSIAWRTYLPMRSGGWQGTKKELKAAETYFEAAPTHTSELLETETYRVVDWLKTRAAKLADKSAQTTERHESLETEEPIAEDSTHHAAANHAAFKSDDVLAFVLSNAGNVRGVLRFNDLIDHDRDDDKTKKDKKDRLARLIVGATVIVNGRFGGLLDGLLNDDSNRIPRSADDGGIWIAQPGSTAPGGPVNSSAQPVIRFRVHSVSAAQTLEDDRNWRERLRFASERSEEGDVSRWLVIEKWRHDAATEEDRSAGRAQALDEHQSWTAQKALELAKRIGLDETLTKMLVCAARLHDEGKRAERWQRAFNAKRDGKVYAKTKGPLNLALLDGYRHEFGSLPFAQRDAAFKTLPSDMQDLALHLIAAHHGQARPVISTSNCEDAPPSALEDRAREVALRFAGLQKRWGPWGLAWWEALLRAADQQASRDNDALDNTKNRESM
jgi:CRISPR-associated endonuclease/helicase Cas3